MRYLTRIDAHHAILGGGVFACGGGGWRQHGELMGQIATSIGRPHLAEVDELAADSWVATVTAIGAPASRSWEIQPVDYVDALKALMDAIDAPIAAVMTAQNGYSTTLNGWIQSAVLDVVVLDAAGDVRAHPTGKLGSMGLANREGYVSTQVVSGGNRELCGHLRSVNRGSVSTCDDILRDISVRTGGFIASARNPVELSWVKDHAALGSISLALKLGAAMAHAQESTATAPASILGAAVTESVLATIGAKVMARGHLREEKPLVTRGGFDHGTFRVADHTVPYLNEFMAVDCEGVRVASYPDTIAILRVDTGLPLAVKDAEAGIEVLLVVADARTLPLSSSAVDEAAVAECEQLMGIELVEYLPSRSLV